MLNQINVVFKEVSLKRFDVNVSKQKVIPEEQFGTNKD